MIANLKPYPVMKASDVPWIGKVPNHWTRLPGRACYREEKVLNKGLTENTVLSLSYGQIVVKPPEKLHGLVPASFETYQIVEPGDIIVRPTDLQNDWNSLRFGLSRDRGVITSAYMCLHTEEAVTRPYGHLLLHTYDLKKVFYGLGSGLRQNLDWRDFKYLPCIVPPLPEQAAIVRYLDHADRRLRRYICSKQKLITLLEEQKQAIIHQAVTGQIDVRTGQTYPAYKTSGVEWLGDVPEHWEVRRLKTLCSMKSGDGITAMSIEPAGEYPVYGGNGLRGYTSNYTHDGNFALIGRQGALCGNVHIARGQFWASEHAVVATIHSGHVLEWFGAILGVMNLNQYSIAAAQPGLAVERVLDLWLPGPPSEEQAVIATYIERQNRRHRCCHRPRPPPNRAIARIPNPPNRRCRHRQGGRTRGGGGTSRKRSPRRRIRCADTGRGDERDGTGRRKRDARGAGNGK